MPAATDTLRLSRAGCAERPGVTITRSGAQARRSGGMPAPSLPSTNNIYQNYNTVGVNRNCTLVFINFSAQDASILNISMAIFKRRS